MHGEIRSENKVEKKKENLPSICLYELWATAAADCIDKWAESEDQNAKTKFQLYSEYWHILVPRSIFASRLSLKTSQS